MSETRNELVLAQNQHAFIQDETKGIVQVIVGPFKTGLTASDRPVRYDALQKKFVICSLTEATSQNPTIAEDSYVILENPAKEIDKVPSIGSQVPAALQAGRKINLPGPTSFALWPGQVATVVQGHQLKSNEYILVRVYSVEEAKKNWPKDTLEVPEEIVVGQLLVIKGTDVSFFIPPTGLEVVKDQVTGNYTRQAVTLEQLEYCILLDQNGTKRYGYGPQVVFPEATESLIKRKSGSATAHGKTTDDTVSVKFKAIELNDQMGLHLKVIQDYEENGRKYKTGEELFITGKDTKFYFPRVELAVIEYGSDDVDFKRQRHYAITIPKGEARYVLNRDLGKIEMITGERIFLADPRYQMTVRRVLDTKTVKLWYPGNTEAIAYNDSLAGAVDRTGGYVAETTYAAAMDINRSINRTTSRSIQSQASEVAGDTLKRPNNTTPPPYMTLNTKYEGPPTINVWTGYAVQIVDKTGNRRVVKGPATILLQFDETLEELVLSSGNPKTTDNLRHDVYLRVDHNKVSDTIEVETKDMVTAKIKVSYRVNFEGDSAKWFSVENYVKFMCDHIRSMVRGVVKKIAIKDLIDNSSSIIRDTVLGAKQESKERIGMLFEENNMRVYDVEVLGFTILDAAVAEMIQKVQKKAVSDALTVTSKQQELENTSIIQKIEQQLQELSAKSVMQSIELQKQKDKATNEAALAKFNGEQALAELKAHAALEIQSTENLRLSEELKVIKDRNEHQLVVADASADIFVKRMGSLTPSLTEAVTKLANTDLAEKLGTAVAPLAIMEQQGVSAVLKRLFSGMPAVQKDLSSLIAE